MRRLTHMEEQVLREMRKYRALSKDQVVLNLGWWVNGDKLDLTVAFEALARDGIIRPTGLYTAQGRELWEVSP